MKGNVGNSGIGPGGRSATITRSLLTFRQVILAVPARRMLALEASSDSRKITSRLLKFAISSAVTSWPLSALESQENAFNWPRSSRSVARALCSLFKWTSIRGSLL